MQLQLGMQRVLTPIKSNELFLKKESIVVFVCGAQSKTPHAHSARDILIRYADRHLPDFSFFRAEDAIEQLSDKRRLNLLQIENELALYADCIIIVLESPSAIAELGAFSNVPSLAKLILAINDNQFVLSPSFISRGPLRTVAAESRFGPVIYTNLSSVLECAPEVGERLRKAARKKGIRVDMSTGSAFGKALPKYRLLFVADMVGLLSPVTKEEMYEFFEVLYGSTPKRQLDLDLGMLEALDLVRSLDGYMLRTPSQAGQFYRYHPSAIAVARGGVLRGYSKAAPRRLEVLLEHSRQ